jgi:hypothetical protein
MLVDDLESLNVRRVGLPLEVVRTLDPVYLDQARADFADYVRKTLAASQSFGGRFNPPGEFGALYTASDEETAWAEIAARYRRQGIPGLPQEMGLLRLQVESGRYVDFSDGDTCASWHIAADVLSREELDGAERELCWDVARATRAVADFLMTRSARADGANMPLFADREGGELRIDFLGASRRSPPEYLTQVAWESW